MNYPTKVGESLDRFLNVALLNGAVDETISIHAAKRANDGAGWACLLCRWLSWTVETDHCPKALSSAALTLHAGLVSAAQLLVLFGALTGGFWFAVLR